MDNFNIYKDIADRTQGDIYVGVVGPVRTGKSTFIKKFMDLMVIPKIDNTYKRKEQKMSYHRVAQEKIFTQQNLNLYLMKQ
ncbi:ABC-type polar amino acid transport system ATPase subunit [Clostridium beijerinckii]|nr:ABC-type polar amino acid transport system ATPase subunit [Clostridium beijerinckii]